MRYVVLHHTGWIEDHFDLMLETNADGPLQTWRLDAFPDARSFTPLPAHRRAYLDYEGPVSNNRGRVKRVAVGDYEVIRSNDKVWVVELVSSNPVRLSLPRSSA